VVTDNAPPSGSPADYGSLPGLLRIFGEKLAQGMDDMLPARVVAYDRDANRATVQPLVQMVTTQGERVSRAQIPSVPVFQYAGGGFVIAFPLAPGDLGWIKAADRDLSLVLQGEPSEAEPNTARTHSFQDGVFYPDVMRSWDLNPQDDKRLVIQSTNGATRIAIGDEVIVLTALTSVTVNAPTVTVNADTANVNGTDVNVTATAVAKVTAPVIRLEGNVVVTGSLSAAGGLSGAGGLSFETHKHTGVTVGGGTTGGPTP